MLLINHREFISSLLPPCHSLIVSGGVGTIIKGVGLAATLIGALMLARAADDARLSKAIRQSARELVRDTVG